MMRALYILVALAALCALAHCDARFSDEPFQQFRREVHADPTPSPMPEPSNQPDPSPGPDPSASPGPGATATPTPSSKSSSDGGLVYSWEMYLIQGVLFIVVFLFALVFCFFGYRFFKKLVAVMGAVFGYIFGYYLTTFFFNEILTINDGWVFWVALGIGLVCLIVGAVVAFQFYFIAVFLVGGFTGVLVGWALWRILYQELLDNTWASVCGWITIVLLFVLFGLLAWKVQRIIIMVCTAIIGGFLIVGFGFGVFRVMIDAWTSWDIWWIVYIEVPLAILMSIGGFVYQYKTIHMDEFDNEFREKDKILYG